MVSCGKLLNTVVGCAIVGCERLGFGLWIVLGRLWQVVECCSKL